MTPLRLLPFALLLVACGNRSDPPADRVPSGVSSVNSASPAASLAPGASGSALAPGASGSALAPGSAAPVGASETWKGSFKARPGAVNLNKEATEAIKVWSKDPGTVQVGDGTLTLSIAAPPRRTVTGSIDGALGSLVLNGEVDGKTLRARVDPRDPNTPDAMTGVLQGTFEGDSPEVTLRVSGRNGNIVREATFKLAK